MAGGGGAGRLDDFRAMIDRLARAMPPEFSDGIVAIEVSPKTLPHPRRGDVYTLGECIPLEWSGSGADLQSRVVLYHGSFAALDRKSTRLNSSHLVISYAVFCLKKKNRPG